MIDLAEDLVPACRSKLEAVGSKLEASKPRWKLGAGSSKLASASLTPSERRTLGIVLGFLAGLVALGPVAALGAAVLGALAARFTDSR